MLHIFQSQKLGLYNQQATVGLVSEKFDGSNIAITSRGVVASRRKVLLMQPTQLELEKFTFSGVNLAKVAGMFEHLKRLETELKNIVTLIELDEAIVYGELIQKGTATSKEDLYQYRSRGIETGDILVFGAGVSIAGNIGTRQMEEVLELLRAHNFDVIGGPQDNDNDPCKELSDSPGPKKVAILMNAALAELLARCGFDKVVQQTSVPFTQLAQLYEEKLVRGEVEGVVVGFDQELLKWKSATESQQFYLEEIEATRPVLDSRTFQAFKAVAEESIRRNAKKTEQNSTTQNILEAAYNSALTKMRTVEEHLESGGLVETYTQELQEEMMKDQPTTGKLNIEFFEGISRFIKLKIYGKTL